MPITLAEHDVIPHPWLGLGIGWDAETKDIRPLPLTQEQWQLLFQRVDSMRPSWLRSMLNTGWFCPGGTVGTYSFDSVAMQGWYPILDYAKARAIPMMIGTWDAVPWGFSAEDYATALIDLVQHLVLQRGYTQIRYVSALNEPDAQVPDFASWREGARNIQALLEERGLSHLVSLVGPDTSWTNGWITGSDLLWNERSFLGAYEWHHYERTCCNIRDGEVEKALRPIVERLTRSAHSSLKPVLLGEIGWGYQSGPGDHQYHVKDYQYGVEMADFAIQLARAGVSGAAAWNLDDAMHNKVWGMWNIVDEPALRPWYYAWSLLSRYFPAGALLYRPTSPDSRLRLLAARIPDGQDTTRQDWSVAIVNRGDSPGSVELTLPHFTASKPFGRAIYSEQSLPGNLESLFEQSAVSGPQMGVQVPANGLLLVSSLSEQRHGRATRQGS